MKDGFTVGVAGRADLTVRETNCTRRGQFLIFSTPNMVQLLENAAISALEPYLTSSELSVGTRVDVKHLAPSLLGARVHADATVTAIDRAAVTFRVDVFEGSERVGAAEHQRYVLDSDRYMRRLEARAATAGGNVEGEKDR